MDEELLITEIFSKDGDFLKINIPKLIEHGLRKTFIIEWEIGDQKTLVIEVGSHIEIDLQNLEKHD